MIRKEIEKKVKELLQQYRTPQNLLNSNLGDSLPKEIKEYLQQQSSLEQKGGEKK